MEWSHTRQATFEATMDARLPPLPYLDEWTAQAAAAFLDAHARYVTSWAELRDRPRTTPLRDMMLPWIYENVQVIAHRLYPIHEGGDISFGIEGPYGIANHYSVAELAAIEDLARDKN